MKINYVTIFPVKTAQTPPSVVPIVKIFLFKKIEFIVNNSLCRHPGDENIHVRSKSFPVPETLLR